MVDEHIGIHVSKTKASVAVLSTEVASGPDTNRMWSSVALFKTLFVGLN